MSNCMYCDNSTYNNPFKMGHARRVRSLLQPWKYVHKVSEYGLGGNMLYTWSTVNYKRVRCTTMSDIGSFRGKSINKTMTKTELLEVIEWASKEISYWKSEYMENIDAIYDSKINALRKL